MHECIELPTAKYWEDDAPGDPWSPWVPVPALPPVEPWQKVFLDAADIIETRGLAKGRIEDAQGRVCTAWALCIAYGLTRDDVIPDALMDIMRRFHRYTSAELCADICGWSNSHTKEEVVAALRSAASLSGGTK